MAYLHDDVYDSGLSELDTDVTALHLCSQEPTTYTEAITTYTLGTKATPTVAAPSARTGGGRKVTISAISDGEVTATGTATHWALVDGTGTRLMAAAALSSSQAITDGNTFTLSAFDVGIPGPV